VPVHRLGRPVVDYVIPTEARFVHAVAAVAASTPLDSGWITIAAKYVLHPDVS